MVHLVLLSPTGPLMVPPLLFRSSHSDILANPHTCQACSFLRVSGAAVLFVWSALSSDVHMTYPHLLQMFLRCHFEKLYIYRNLQSSPLSQYSFIPHPELLLPNSTYYHWIYFILRVYILPQSFYSCEFTDILPMSAAVLGTQEAPNCLLSEWVNT